MQAIQAMGLVKRYKDVTAVDGLDLEIKEGIVLTAWCQRCGKNHRHQVGVRHFAL